MYSTSENPLNKLAHLASHEMRSMMELVRGVSQSKHSALISKVIDYIVASGGKNIRPLLAISAAKMFNYNGDAHILLATAVECMHIATLLHDDVVDESVLRRGIETVNIKWGNQISILVGDYLFSQAFKFMVQTGAVEAMAVLADAAATISEAEVLQLQLLNDIEITDERYYQLIIAKTAALFSASCQVGGVAAGASQKQIDALREYGTSFGTIFQMIDDILDYYGQRDEIGKRCGNDFFEGKVTLPLIILYREAFKDDKKLIKSFFELDYTRKQNDLQVILKLFDKYDIRTKALRSVSDIVYNGIEASKNFPDSEFSRLMVESLKHSVNRTF